MPRPLKSSTLAALKDLVGTDSWLTGGDVTSFTRDFRGLYQGNTPLVLLPRSSDQVSEILKFCDQYEIAVVPQGGNTSYCGAATPDESGSQIVLSMRRLKKIREVDASNNSMIVEAGCTLAEVHAAARDADRLFPLSLGSEGTAQIGGNLSTNAGGTAVLRYGMMRDLVFGLEVVLADGRVLSSLKSLRKDNTGYDLKSLFIGAEGTLGVITAASLKLYSLPTASATAVIGVASPRDALNLFDRLRRSSGDTLSTFELMPRRAVELACAYIEGVANPVDQPAPWYLLIELTSSNLTHSLAELLSTELVEMLGAGVVQNGVIATSLTQAAAMWKLRESIPEAQRRHGASLKHDISVPLSAIPTLIEAGSAIIRRLVPEGEVIAYGHLGDGNLHFNVSQLVGSDLVAFKNRGSALQSAIFDLVESLNGSISAEHGIGRLKAAEFAQRADPIELNVMLNIKRGLDPKGILNPGKVFL